MKTPLPWNHLRRSTSPNLRLRSLRCSKLRITSQATVRDFSGSLISQNHGTPTSHKPELVLNNVTIRLRHRIGRVILQ